jgi:adenylylsulfate kinase
VDFTGVDDTYEEPQDPDIIVDTEQDTIERSLEKVIDHIVKRL